MTEGQCVYIVIQDPSLVIGASHEILGLLHLADSEPLMVVALETTIDHSILLTLCLKYTLVQIDALNTHSLTIDYHILWNTLCRIGHYVLLINQIIHLWSKSHELGDTMIVVFILENGSR